MAELVVLWLATYALHSTVLLGAVWGLERIHALRTNEVREWAWRLALFGAIATAGAQLAWVRAMPARDAPRVTIPAAAAVVAESPASKRAVTGAPTVATATTARWPRTPELVPRFELPRVSLLDQIALAWAAFALAGVLLVAARLFVLRSRLRTMPPCVEPGVLVSVARLAHEAGVAAPSVALLEAGGSPVVVPPARLCVPEWTLTELDARQRDAMLAHEIAHVMRRDPLWRVGAELVCCALFFQPLNRLAARRLDALAELACDAWAARCGDGRALAECLVACAERVRFDAPRLAAAMARPRSPLIERIQSLLEENPMLLQRPLRTLLSRFALAAALPCVMLLPAIGMEHAAASEPRHSSIEISSSWFGKYMSFDVDLDDGARLSAKIKGDIRFNDAEDDIASLDDEAWIEEIRGGTKRRIELENAKGGAITRKFYVDGKEQPYDATARRWLAGVVPTLMRESAYEAEARVGRIHKRGGADAVLAEIAEINSNYARRNYLEALAALGPMNDAQLMRAFALTGTMKSDYERRVAMQAFVEHFKLAPASQAALLDVVAKLDSDYEKRVTLADVAPQLESDPAVTAAWSKALATIDSDYEARESIDALATRDRLDAAQVEAALAATKTIGSDYETRTALSSLAPHLKRQPELGAAYARATREIDSDYERREALTALVESAPLDAAAYAAVLDATAEIDSDYECRTTLVAIAEHMPADAALIKRYREIARRLGDYERGQAEKALDRFAAL